MQQFASVQNGMAPLWSLLGLAGPIVHPSPKYPAVFCSMYKQPVCSSHGQAHDTPRELEWWESGGVPTISLRVGRSFLPHQEAHQRPDRMVPDKAMEFGI